MNINDESRKVYARFWNAVEAELDEVKAAKLKVAMYFLFSPTGQDFIKAAEVLSEMGF
jgi:hypothetical protein